MVKLSGRPEAPDQRRGRTLSFSARGAQPAAPHGTLQRLLEVIRAAAPWRNHLRTPLVGCHGRLRDKTERALSSQPQTQSGRRLCQQLPPESRSPGQAKAHNSSCPTVKLRGRPEAPDKRRGRILSSSARGAKPTTPHGTLQRLVMWLAHPCPLAFARSAA